MSNTIVLGMQWGDEGKGKVVDLLCPAFDAVARYQGGHNAGHTVKFGDRHFALHLVPSGILHPQMRCVLGNGMVINPEALFGELDRLGEAGVEIAGRLFVSSRAHLLLPAYALLDQAREAAAGKGAIGTTARGIGPAFELKAARFGLRLADLFTAELEERVRRVLERLDRELEALGAEPVEDPDAVVEECLDWRERLRPLMRDTAQLLNGWIDEGRGILFEGAQGTLLDLDHGTFPYVSSSNSTAGGACTGSGVPPRRIDGVLGVVKAYTTRVGGGPFVAELEDKTGEYLRERGNEFGTTTGRPRRCGWLDAVAARYSRILNGVDTIALTKLDVLDTLEEIKVCVGYRIDGHVTEDFPTSLEELSRVVPVFRTLRGWRKETVGTLEFEDLPQGARDYVELIEEVVGAPVGILSTGPRREETIVRSEPNLHRLTAGRLDEVLAQRAAMAG